MRVNQGPNSSQISNCLFIYPKSRNLPCSWRGIWNFSIGWPKCITEPIRVAQAMAQHWWIQWQLNTSHVWRAFSNQEKKFNLDLGGNWKGGNSLRRQNSSQIRKVSSRLFAIAILFSYSSARYASDLNYCVHIHVLLNRIKINSEELTYAGFFVDFWSQRWIHQPHESFSVWYLWILSVRLCWSNYDLMLYCWISCPSKLSYSMDLLQSDAIPFEMYFCVLLLHCCFMLLIIPDLQYFV